MQLYPLMININFLIRKLNAKYTLFIYWLTDNTNLLIWINHHTVPTPKFLGKLLLVKRFAFFDRGILFLPQSLF